MGENMHFIKLFNALAFLKLDKLKAIISSQLVTGLRLKFETDYACISLMARQSYWLIFARQCVFFVLVKWSIQTNILVWIQLRK